MNDQPPTAAGHRFQQQLNHAMTACPIIEIRTPDLQHLVQAALRDGHTDRLEVLFEIARRHPEAHFIRAEPGLTKPDPRWPGHVHYSSAEMLIAEQSHIEVRGFPQPSSA